MALEARAFLQTYIAETMLAVKRAVGEKSSRFRDSQHRKVWPGNYFQCNRVDRTIRIVNQLTANRTLFHLRTVDEIRTSSSKRGEGADRNAWLYSYNPLTVKLI